MPSTSHYFVILLPNIFDMIKINDISKINLGFYVVSVIPLHQNQSNCYKIYT